MEAGYCYLPRPVQGALIELSEKRSRVRQAGNPRERTEGSERNWERGGER